MYFAQLDNFKVKNVVNSEPEYIAAGAMGDPESFLETDFYTRGNVHYNDDRKPDGLSPFRGNFGQIGFTYDPQADVFYAPQPYPSWLLNRRTWLWEPPMPMPIDGNWYHWDERLLSWVKLEAKQTTNLLTA